jgi:hypothetical protein
MIVPGRETTSRERARTNERAARDRSYRKEENGMEPTPRTFRTLAGLAMALFVAGLFITSSPAFGKAPATGVIVDKNFQKSQITLHTGVILQISPGTRIISEKGTRTTFTALQVTEASDGMVLMKGDALVSYEGRMQGGVVEATTIRVVGSIPR